MDDFQKIFDIIEHRSGIRVNESHRKYVIDIVKKRQTFTSASEYENLLEHDEKECSALIDLTAINETYFFREEIQFDFLKENVFPSFAGKPVVIWSAACSSGEESVSLYTLAKSLGCKPMIFATDIDSETLSEIKKFKWQQKSIRSDGEKYKSVLENFGENENGYWTLNKSDCVNFNISYFNLISSEMLPMPPGSVDIVFLRNVFIYFSRENQKNALKRMCEALKPGGLLFLSISEIASVDELGDIPLIKEHKGAVYYLRKLTEAEFKTQREIRLWQKKSAPKTIDSSMAKQTSLHLAKQTLNQTNQNESAKNNPKTESRNSTPQKTISIEKIADEFLKLLAQKDYETAKKTLESHNFKSQHIEYKYYLLGRLHNETGDTKNEQSNLNKAVIANPKFWPAWFSLGVLYNRTNQTAKKTDSFRRCKEILENCIKENKTEYNFIVESFDLSYFLKLCDYYLGNN